MRPGAARAAVREAQVFTGIISELGKVAAVERQADSARLTIDAPSVAASSAHGSSVAVNGVCVTVTRAGNGQFSADLMGETLARTSLGALAPGAPVNLESPVVVGARLDGHIVQGHVDGTGVIAERRPGAGWAVVRICADPELLRYVAEKGSVALDGVSLTVSALGTGWFEVSLIPETLARTTLGGLAPGDRVNIEVDVLAKYVERLLARGER
jgi:riboflavin synthase